MSKVAFYVIEICYTHDAYVKFRNKAYTGRVDCSFRLLFYRTFWRKGHVEMFKKYRSYYV